MFYYLELYENVVHKIIKTFLLQDTSYISTKHFDAYPSTVYSV